MHPKLVNLKNYEQGLGKPFKKPKRKYDAIDGSYGSLRYSLSRVEYHGSQGYKHCRMVLFRRWYNHFPLRLYVRRCPHRNMGLSHSQKDYLAHFCVQYSHGSLYSNGCLAPITRLFANRSQCL